MIGMKVAAVETLLLSSVQTMSANTIVTISSGSGQLPSPASAAPSVSESVLSWIAAASARPPPNSSITAHGNLCMSAARSSAPPSRARTTNGATPARIAITVSSSRASGDHCASQGRRIHRAAAPSAIRAMRRSSTVIGPSRWRPASTASAATGTARGSNGRPTRVTQSHAHGNSRATVGRPNASQSRKLMSTPKLRDMNPCTSALVGVPMSVPMPPIVAP